MERTLSPFKQKIAALSRDKVDTLMLVVTCSLVLIPFTEYSPDWLNLVAAIFILWRVWITFQGFALPKKWQLTVISGVLMTAVYLHFHTWLGRDAGIAFLVALVCLKMLELHVRRDAFSLIFVCYFLLAGQLMYSQSLPSALYLLFCTGLLISTQFAFQYHQLVPKLSVRILSGFKILALAIPLALILFLFFPRIQGPLWGKQQGNLGGITGLSDSMEPGNVAELAQSDLIAFRVKFQGQVPSPTQLYWRAVILDTFNGSRWTASTSNRGIEVTVPAGLPVKQEIIMEPDNQRWLFGLDQPNVVTNYNGVAIDSTNNPGIYLTRYGEMRSPKLITDRLRYTISSNLVNTLNPTEPVSESREILNRALQLPPGFNPLTQQWARQMLQNSSNPNQLANLVLRYFHDQPYIYTLSPPLLGTNQVDDFLFNTRAGFCEHYASAFVVIMRAMHIPARIVTGYQGGEINSIDGLMTVRQSDAHAWAEIWMEGRGWVRFDPTAAVAPNRVERGINASFPNRNLTGLLNLNQQSWLAGAARQLRASWDATNSAWNLWVLNYSIDKQLNLFSDISGIEHPQAAQLGVAMMIAASLVVGTLSFILLGKKTVISPLDKLYLRFCRHMNRFDAPRAPHEGPLDYAQRIALRFPNHSALLDFLQLYARCKYGRGYNSEQLTQLKHLLKLCLQLKTARVNSSKQNDLL